MDKLLIFIGAYVGEGVSGSHRQERFIRKALQEGFLVRLLKPHGRFKGQYEFVSLSEFEQWKDNHAQEAKGSINNSFLKRYLISFKYIFFLDILGYGFFKTIILLRQSYKDSKWKDAFILVSSPAMSSAVAVYLASNFSKMAKNYIIDMRDPWALHPSITIFKRARKFVERKVLKNARAVVTVSNYLKEEFDNAYGVSAKVIYNVNLNLNLKKVAEEFSTDKNNTIRPDLDKSVNICYFGSLPFGFYNIEDFCEGLLIYIRKEGSVGVKFNFYGPCLELENTLQRYPTLKNMFEFNCDVSHTKAIELMQNCDAVLFMAYNAEKNAGMVSTKVFEYFYLNVKIIPFDVRKGSDLEFLFQKICGQSVLINDPETFANYLEEVLPNLEKGLRTVDSKLLLALDLEYNNFIRNIENYKK